MEAVAAFFCCRSPTRSGPWCLPMTTDTRAADLATVRDLIAAAQSWDCEDIPRGPCDSRPLSPSTWCAPCLARGLVGALARIESALSAASAVLRDPDQVSQTAASADRKAAVVGLLAAAGVPNG